MKFCFVHSTNIGNTYLMLLLSILFCDQSLMPNSCTINIQNVLSSNVSWSIEVLFFISDIFLSLVQKFNAANFFSTANISLIHCLMDPKLGKYVAVCTKSIRQNSKKIFENGILTRRLLINFLCTHTDCEIHFFFWNFLGLEANSFPKRILNMKVSLAKLYGFVTSNWYINQKWASALNNDWQLMNR